jgi:hypothetical protein
LFGCGRVDPYYFWLLITALNFFNPITWSIVKIVLHKQSIVKIQIALEFYGSIEYIEKARAKHSKAA